MSRYPSATWRPIADTSTRTVQKDILCWHTAVGGGLSTWNYFNRLDIGVYSHGVICGIWGADASQDVDGLALQMADTDYRAAANLDGNWRVISWETGDNATRPIKPWTPKQCTTIVAVMVDANRLDGIPLVLVPDSKVGRRGVGYHRLGCDPYRVPGGELWSSAYAKDCPTDPRIKQLPGLVDQARIVVAGGNPPTESDVLEEFMALYDTAADFEAAMERVNYQGTTRALKDWLPRYYLADNGIPNAYFASAASQSLRRKIAEQLGVSQETLAKIEQDIPDPDPTPPST